MAYNAIMAVATRAMLWRKLQTVVFCIDCHCTLAVLSLVLTMTGCSDKKPTQEELMSVAQKLTGLKAENIEEIRDISLQLKDIVKKLHDRGDFERLKKACADIDKRFSQRILGWYADVLYIEHTQGTEEAVKEIRRLQAQSNLSKHERQAISNISDLFSAKGEQTTAKATVRLFMMVLAVYLESEFGHGGGAAVGAVIEMTAPGSNSPAGTNNQLKQ